jgi:lipoprotein NlpI
VKLKTAPSIALLLLTLSLCPAKAQTDSNVYLERAAEEESRGEHAAAIQDCSRAIQLNPHSADAYGCRAYAKSTVGDRDGAVADYSKAIELRPSDDKFYVNRGLVKVQKPDFEGGFADFSKAAALNPSNEDAHHCLGLVLYDQHSWTRSLAEFTTAEHLDPHDVYNHIRISLVLARMGHNVQAANELNLAAGQMTHDDALSWKYSVLSFLRGHLSEASFLAKAKSEDSVGTADRKCEAYFYAGTVRLLHGDKPTARKYFSQSVGTGRLNESECVSSRAELKALDLATPSR